MRRLFPIALWAACILAGGCSRLRFTVWLAPEDSALRETVVRADEGAGEAAVALIDVRGLIVNGPAPGLLLPGPNPVDELAARLDAASKSPHVRGVVLRINSPGGTVTASDVMHREVRRFSEESGKPVVAMLDEVAASGGYYLALAADEIVAEPTSLTGSVGVIFPTLNVSEGLGMIGIRSRAVTSGPNKAMANPLEPARDEHYAILQGIVDEDYARFRRLVEERRPGLDRARADEATDGRIVTGAQAVRLGLADREGSIGVAFERVKERAGVKAARMIKYTSGSARRPRTPYATSDASEPHAASDGAAVRIDLGRVGEWAGVLPPMAYYLWVPNAER